MGRFPGGRNRPRGLSLLVDDDNTRNIGTNVSINIRDIRKKVDIKIQNIESKAVIKI